jgi:hypothetical protein
MHAGGSIAFHTQHVAKPLPSALVYIPNGISMYVCACVRVCMCVSVYPWTGHYMRTETHLPSSKAVFQASASLAHLAATRIFGLMHAGGSIAFHTQHVAKPLPSALVYIPNGISMCVCACVYVYVCVYVCAFMRMYVHVCACV